MTRELILDVTVATYAPTADTFGYLFMGLVAVGVYLAVRRGKRKEQHPRRRHGRKQ